MRPGHGSRGKANSQRRREMRFQCSIKVPSTVSGSVCCGGCKAFFAIQQLSPKLGLLLELKSCKGKFWTSDNRVNAPSRGHGWATSYRGYQWVFQGTRPIKRAEPSQPRPRSRHAACLSCLQLPGFFWTKTFFVPVTNSEVTSEPTPTLPPNHRHPRDIQDARRQGRRLDQHRG